MHIIASVFDVYLHVVVAIYLRLDQLEAVSEWSFSDCHPNYLSFYILKL